MNVPKITKTDNSTINHVKFGGGVISELHPLHIYLSQTEGKRLHSPHILFPNLGCAEQENGTLPGERTWLPSQPEPQPCTTLPSPTCRSSHLLPFIFLTCTQKQTTLSMQHNRKQRKGWPLGALRHFRKSLVNRDKTRSMLEAEHAGGKEGLLGSTLSDQFNPAVLTSGSWS